VAKVYRIWVDGQIGNAGTEGQVLDRIIESGISADRIGISVLWADGKHVNGPVVPLNNLIHDLDIFIDAYITTEATDADFMASYLESIADDDKDWMFRGEDDEEAEEEEEANDPENWVVEMGFERIPDGEGNYHYFLSKEER